MSSDSPKGRAVIILLLSLAIVALVSLLPLEKLTSGFVKDFDLLADIRPAQTELTDSLSQSEAEDIDPELQKIQTAPAEFTDSATRESTDTIITVPRQPTTVNGQVVIEDYTAGTLHPLQSLRAALASGGHARIAVVGDSYIEGDIFTQDLRQLLQNAYGGQGVGYVNMHSDFPGFRKSIRQGGDGWTTFTAQNKANAAYLALSEQYAKPAGVATATYKGTKTFAAASSWSISRMLCIAPQGGSVDYRTDPAQEWSTFTFMPDSTVQCLTIANEISNLELRTSDKSLVALGVWLDGKTGISVDCMSSRGYSGITLAKINPDLCHQMSLHVPYNLIVLEFGINAMSAKQKDYSTYSQRMVAVVNHIRTCYPEADILMMGIGDRGEKRSGQVHSMSTADAMVEAQRQAAMKAHCLFWDTRQAMGGQDAIVDWSNDGRANKDYIHLTHKGGATLAQLFFNALQQSLQ